MQIKHIDFMNKTIKTLILIMAWLVGLFVFAGCNNADGTFSVRHSTIDVGEANVGDSVSASFTFRNNKSESISITFIPECDCTTISTEAMKLEPRGCGQLDVKVAVENSGEFIKYVYAQTVGEEDFLAIAVKGRTK